MKWFTTAWVAEDIKRTPAWVARLARREGLGRKRPGYGPVTWFTENEVATLRQRRRVGRPSKGANK